MINQSKNFFAKCRMLQSVCRYPSIRYLFPKAVAQRCKKVVPGNFAKIRRKHLCQRLFFDKVVG